MLLSFGKYQKEGEEILMYLADELGCPKDMERAGHVLKAVLVGLRRRLSFERAFQLFKILPFSLKKIFLIDWDVEEDAPANIEDLDDFIEEIQHYDTYLVDMVGKEQAKHAIEAVFRVIKWYVSNSQMDKIHHLFPKGLRESITVSPFIQVLDLQEIS